ncbi:MAG TPA: diguanylate cyclase [Longilinea sp.]|nr:diguanylate cyclase [Longilinea sp.]
MALPVDNFNSIQEKSPIGYFYQTPAETINVLSGFFRVGFDNKQKIICQLPHAQQQKTIPMALLPQTWSDRISLDGQLEFISPPFHWDQSDRFIPEKLTDWIVNQRSAAITQGFHSVRIWLDFTWALKDINRSEIVADWLIDLAKLHLADTLVCCSYDQSEIEAEKILRLLPAHASLYSNQKVVANPVYQIPLRSNGDRPIDLLTRFNTYLRNQSVEIPSIRSDFNYLSTLFSNLPYGMVTTDQDGLIRTVNPKALYHLGYAQSEDLISISLADLISPGDRAQVVHDLFEETVPGKSERRIECNLLTRDGFAIPVEMRSEWMEFPEPYGTQLICYFNDITHHFEIEQALRNSEQRYRFLVEYQGEGVVMINSSAKVDYINAAGSTLLGGTPESIVGLPITTFIPDNQLDDFRQQSNMRRKGVSSSYELTIQSLDNIQRDVLVTATPRYSPEGKYNGTVAIFRDISERKQLEEKLRYQSTHDTMTRLFNRAFFDQAVENYNPAESPIASIIVIDVDGLKVVNDSEGHKAGDKLLQKVASILKESFRTNDSIARIGGDEFAILLQETDEIQLNQAIIRLRHNLEQANDRLPEVEQISFSIGGATTAPTRGLNQALMLADMRMYHQKRRKKASHGSQLLE